MEKTTYIKSTDSLTKNEKNVNIRKLNKNEVLNLLDNMFDTISINMENIIDTGNTKDENYKNWKNSMLKELDNNHKKWVGAFENNVLIGYFLYKVNNNTVNLDEIQVVKNHQGDGYTFIKLFKYILRDRTIKDTYMVTTYVNKNNIKSKAIVNKFGFKVLEQKERGIKYINSFINLKEKLEKYAIE